MWYYINIPSNEFEANSITSAFPMLGSSDFWKECLKLLHLFEAILFGATSHK